MQLTSETNRPMTNPNNERIPYAFDHIPNAQPNSQGMFNRPLILLHNDVILPYEIRPLSITNAFYPNVGAANRAIQEGITVIVANVHPDVEQRPLEERIFRVGTEVALLPMPDGRQSSALLMAQGRRRVDIMSFSPDIQSSGYRAIGFPIDEMIEDEEHTQHLREDVLFYLSETGARSGVASLEMIEFILSLEDSDQIADIIAANIGLSPFERQRILEETVLDGRYEVLLQFLLREVRNQQAREEAENSVHDELDRVQREIYLREQMRIIQQELGDTDADNEVAMIRRQLDQIGLPGDVYQQAQRELSRYATMSPMSPESTMLRTYLDWITDLPWSLRSEDNLNVRHAEKVLSEAHYGLEKVKDRVIEHIAVRKLAGEDMKTPILCFVGPPGVGKTSLGRSIAEALGREFVRVSLGGVRDEAEIRGHRRTYIGALPGRIIQTMRKAGTINPVFMLDEIDKLSEDYRGDPAAALLEVLDPEQNDEFADHYLELPYDLSQVLFIATANELYPLPEALEDRMEIIEFRPYTEEEKLEIARRFLIPKQLKAHGLARRGISIEAEALMHIIRHYTLEAGVRNLERQIGAVCRKIARKAASREKYAKIISADMIEEMLGPPIVLDSQLSREDSIGLVTGLVWSSSGGDTQVIEASLLPGKGTLTLTGSLGDVLQESGQIALSYVRSRADDFDIPHDDFENHDVHLHLPEGAVPKDGPSAGITLATAVLSVFIEAKVRSNYCMTGEVTLRGHVLPVGGVKEKLLAARRRGIEHIILPADNEKDLKDVPQNVLDDMQVHFVRNMQQVIDLVMHDPPAERLRDANREEEPEDEETND